jgi:hypothetical protein
MKHNFIPFYPAVMAWCLSQLASLGLQTDRAKTLMGYSMRTASLIGEAVGKEVS